MSPVHLHLALNHVPVIGIVFATALLLAGMIWKSEALKAASLVSLAVLAAVAVVVFLTGEPAEEAVEGLPGVSGVLIERHEAMGKVALILAVALGLLSLIALFFGHRRSRFTSVLISATLLGSVIVAGVMVWTANAGGLIRHTEIRAAAATAADGVTEERHEEERDEHER